MAELRLDRLNVLIEASPKSIGELAELTEVSPEHIWKIRNGRTPNVSAVVLGRLAEALGVATDYLLGMERDESGLPIPEPEVASLLARLNQQSPGQRVRLAEILDQILDLVDSVSGATPAAQLVRLLSSLPEDRREYWQTMIQSEVAEADRAESQSGRIAGVQGGVG